MKIGQPHLAATMRSLEEAPTLLENYFWAALLGISSWDGYLSELLITDLVGPGYVTDDFVGAP